jgi:hypothetical protein
MAVGEYLPPVVTRLSMNIDDFVGGVAKAKAALKALDGDVEIKVDDAGIDAAIAKMGRFKDKTEQATAAQKAFSGQVRDSSRALLYQSAALDAANGSITSMSRRAATAAAAQGRLQHAIDQTNMSLAGQALAGAAARAGLPVMPGRNGLNGGNGINAPNGGTSKMPGWFGFLQQDVTLWGGLLGDAHFIGKVQLWHVAVDALIETFISLGSALADLTIMFASWAAAGDDIFNRLMAISSVNQALGANVPPLTGNFQKLSQSLAPQVVEAYGAALNTVSKNTGTLSSVATAATQGMDNWLARLDLFIKSTSGGGFLQSGLGFLHQFSQVADSLGVSLLNLAKADPGTAHFLMDIATAAAKVVEAVTSLPTWFLQATMAVHSFFLWGGLLATQLLKLLNPISRVALALGGLGAGGAMTGQAAGLAATATAGERTKAVIADIAAGFKAFGSNIASVVMMWVGLAQATSTWTVVSALAKTAAGNLGKALLAVAASPWTWAIIGAAAIAAFTLEMIHADDAAKNFANTMKSDLGNMGVGDAIIQSMTDINTLQKSIASAGAAMNKSISSAGKGGLASWLDPVGIARNLGIIKQQADSVQIYQGALANLNGTQSKLFQGMQHLTSQGLTWNQALAVMDMAGVKAGDGLDLMNQKTDNLLKGYQSLGFQAGILGNSINAVSFAEEQQNSQIQQITQGYSAFINLVTGGVTAFTQFQQQLQGIGTAASTADNKLSVGMGKVSVTTKGAGAAASGAAVKFDDLSSAGLQLQSAFAQGVSSGSQLMNQLYLMASASNLGDRGLHLLTQAGQDMVAQLIPLSQGNRTAASEIYALAQTAGYHGAPSLAALAKWSGTATGKAADLNRIISILTGSSADLATDVNNLANAIQGNLNQAMAQALLQANGGQRVFDNFVSSLQNSKTSAGNLGAAAENLAKKLLAVEGNTTQARGTFESFIIAMGGSQRAADQLWRDLTSGAAGSASAVQRDMAALQSAINSLHGKTITITTIERAIGAGSAPRAGVSSPSALKGYATGTSGAARGWGWVGEKGPELVNFRGGETVIPNQVSRGYAAGAGDFSGDTHVHVYLDGRKIQRTVQKRSATTERRTGTSGLSRRTR